MLLVLPASGQATLSNSLRRTCARIGMEWGTSGFQARSASAAIHRSTRAKTMTAPQQTTRKSQLPLSLLAHAQSVTISRLWLAASPTSSAAGENVRIDSTAMAVTARRLSPLMAEYTRTAPVVSQLLRKTWVNGLSTKQADRWAQNVLECSDAAVIAHWDERIVGALFMTDLASQRPDYAHALGVQVDEPFGMFNGYVKDFCNRFDVRSAFNETAAWYCGSAIVYRHFRGDLGQGFRVFDGLAAESEAMAVDMGYRLMTAVFLSDRTAKRADQRGWMRLGEMRYDEPPLVHLVDAETAERHGSLSVYALHFR